jgi:hypothetical protein
LYGKVGTEVAADMQSQMAFCLVQKGSWIMKSLLAAAAVSALLVASGAANASVLNILWYSGGASSSGTAGDYQALINGLATPGSGDPNPTTWNITYWDSGAMPSGTYNVLVVASPEGSWFTYPDYTDLNAASLTASSFGDRVMITGQDADWHYIFGPGATNFDGPRGFLRDAINWAGNGTGLGLVDLGQNGDGSCSSPTNFGFTGYTGACDSTNSVLIPGPVASFPINQGLTSPGLSNWSTSAHNEFTAIDTTMWNGINIDGGIPGNYVTIVSASTAGGGTGAPGVPEPSTIFLLGAALLSFGWFARKRINGMI